MAQEPHPRRLLAILYADIAGFSRLTDEDEDTTHRVVRESLRLFTSTIEAHGGRVVHFAGDAVLARFDAVVDALATALVVQAELGLLNEPRPEARKVRFRIGVNLGDVIEDGYEIYGHGVNVAARLESMAEPGGICVSEAVRSAAGRYLPITFDFMGEQAAKNIAEPVRAYRVVVEPGAPTATDAVTDGLPGEHGGVVPPPPSAARGSTWTGASDGNSERTRHPARPGPTGQDPTGRSVFDRPAHELSQGTVSPTPARSAPSARPPSIMVLPFLDLTIDPAHACLADGFTEDLITELSRFKSLAVMARTTAFAFKGKALNVLEISESLGVDYVLEGSIRALGSRLRLTAQLIECTHGDHLWANRHDCLVDDIFDLQDQFISEIVAVLEDRIVQSRLREVSRAPIQSLESYDCWLRGMQLMRDWDSESDRASVELFERAIALDPDFARPHSSLAGLYSSNCLLEPGNPSLDGDLTRALDHAHRAQSLDPYDASAHCSVGWVQMVRRRYTEATRAFAKALELNPNDADIAISSALVTAFLGDAVAGQRLANGAIERNPLHPAYYRGYLAIIHCLAGEFAEADTLFTAMGDLHPADFWAWCAAARHHQGDRAGAAAAALQFTTRYSQQWCGTGESSVEAHVTWLAKVTPLQRAGDRVMLFGALAESGLTVPDEVLGTVAGSLP